MMSAFDRVTEEEPWHTANQRCLMDAIAHVASQVEHVVAGEALGHDEPPAMHPGRDFALDRLAEAFGLSPFERAILLLCAGMELNATIASLCARAQRDAARPYPTFGLALATLPGAHWDALSPGSALRYWRLIELSGDALLVASPLRISERVLHYLTGVQHLDEDLAGCVTPEPPPGDLLPSQSELAATIATLCAQSAYEQRELPAVQLVGGDSRTRRAILATACMQVGVKPYTMSAAVLPSSPHDLETLVRLWQREVVLSGAALILDCDSLDAQDTTRWALVTLFADRVGGALFLTVHERRQLAHRVTVSYDVTQPPAHEQHALWEQMLGDAAPLLNGHLERVTAQFNLSAPAIGAVCASVAAATDEVIQHTRTVRHLETALWQACRSQARPQLDDLAQRIPPLAGWEDLVLPAMSLATLRAIAVQVRQRAIVYARWGFAERSNRGLGISALFAGASGTGKTMAAEVLANELDLDLYRIDLSQVVSKYIGETEKNLRRVFDAAEAGGAILLFDEADAIFGKRSEVKDSHDRYANIEVSYLLQRMEAYSGLAILTTNMKSALDAAFLRRLRFIVDFPFPDYAARVEIWQRIFPPQTPTRGLALPQLAQLNMTGGNIRNMALAAAFLAAEDDMPVTMRHIRRAAESEYRKVERVLSDQELRGWE